MIDKPYQPPFFDQDDEGSDEGPFAGRLSHLGGFKARTGDVVVSVRTMWLDDQSSPEERHYCWLYHVIVENRGRASLQLLGRSWTCIGCNGQTHQLEDGDVGGEQPVIAPQSAFEYTATAEMDMPGAFIMGVYHAVHATPAGLWHADDIIVPSFSLDMPSLLLHDKH
ncbi:ApaG domain [Formicincola oecophyllae]|uniref:ApaG domain n=1 Tax=Formicincola oecophyllae TaxID=2558361 RepID=A0A4Y6U8J0_9PROT|nr:ApaG domain [Formicincola oecophyllae]QDH13763.1 ApaG domain [Formicincola oecophyllae]